MTEFTKYQKNWLENHSQCPFCGSDQVSEGPSGGLSQNLYCLGTWVEGGTGVVMACNAGFNSTPFGMELIQESDVPGEQYACGIHVTGKVPKKPKEKAPKYTPDEIVAKFTGHKRRWWSRR